MNSYIILLRGINVSGKNIIKMIELKELLENNHFKDVKTYIQSGNIILKTNELTSIETQTKIHSLIKAKFNLNVPVLVLKKENLESTYLNNPYLKENNRNDSKFLITFIERPLNESDNNIILKVNSKNDEFKIGEKCIYLYCPDGYGKTKFTNNLFESKLKTTASTRNLKTLNKLIELS